MSATTHPTGRVVRQIGDPAAQLKRAVVDDDGLPLTAIGNPFKRELVGREAEEAVRDALTGRSIHDARGVATVDSAHGLLVTVTTDPSGRRHAKHATASFVKGVEVREAS